MGRLVGHSGVHVLLIERDGRMMVRKQAQRPEQNARLKAQCAKQIAARAARISCPAVLAQGEALGCFHFDMEYIAGETLANAAIAGRLVDWSGIIGQLEGILSSFRAASKGEVPPAAFDAKLARIGQQCRSNPQLAQILPALIRTIGWMREQDWRGVPDSPSHGDLTMENVLLRQDGTMALIDFDVAEQSSWLLDVAKLFQDARGYWCIRHLETADTEPIASLNARLRLDRVAGHLQRMLGTTTESDGSRLNRLIAFHLLRTLPYATDSAVSAFVMRRIDALLQAK